MHTPEYAFEKVTGNVEKGAADLGITYPVALDNNYSTWTNYRNRYWPAEYLIDANGTVRHIKFGEGDYDGTEKLIRELITDAHSRRCAAPAGRRPRHHPARRPHARDLLRRSARSSTTAAPAGYDEGPADVRLPAGPAGRRIRPAAARGRWTTRARRPTATTRRSELNYRAKNVYLVVGGTGTVAVTRDGKSTTLPVGGPPTSHQIVAGDQVTSGTVEVRPSKGLQVFSFTYG